MRSGVVRRLMGWIIALAALMLSLDAAAPPTADARRAGARNLQDLVDALKTQLELPVEITATFVPVNPLVVSVEPDRTRSAFVMSFQEGFLEGLDEDEVRAIVAHELGHVWIFTHHPYLQTERLANEVALRIVSRDSLEKVYTRVWAHGAKGDLAKFLPTGK